MAEALPRANVMVPEDDTSSEDEEPEDVPSTPVGAAGSLPEDEEPADVPSTPVGSPRPTGYSPDGPTMDETRPPRRDRPTSGGADARPRKRLAFSTIHAMIRVNAYHLLGESAFKFRDDLTPAATEAYTRYYKDLNFYISIAVRSEDEIHLAVHYPGYFESETFADTSLAKIGRQYRGIQTPFDATGVITSDEYLDKCNTEGHMKAIADLAETKAFSDKNQTILEAMDGQTNLHLTALTVEPGGIKDSGFYYYTRPALRYHFRKRLGADITLADGTVIESPGRMFARSALHVRAMVQLTGNTIPVKIDDGWKGYVQFDAGDVSAFLDEFRSTPTFTNVFDGEYTDRVISQMESKNWTGGPRAMRSEMLNFEELKSCNTRRAEEHLCVHFIAPLMAAIVHVGDFRADPIASQLFDRYDKVKADETGLFNDMMGSYVCCLLKSAVSLDHTDTTPYYNMLVEKRAGGGTESPDEEEMADKKEEGLEKYKKIPGDTPFPFAWSFVHRTIDELFYRPVDDDELRLTTRDAFLRCKFALFERTFSAGPKPFFAKSMSMFEVAFCVTSYQRETYFKSACTLSYNSDIYPGVAMLAEVAYIDKLVNKLERAPVIITEGHTKANKRREHIIKGWTEGIAEARFEGLERATGDSGIYSLWMGAVKVDFDEVWARPAIGKIMAAPFTHTLM